MSKRTFQQILEAAGFECASYSGRGMYGEKCLSFTIEGNAAAKIGRVFADVLEVIEPEENEVASHAFRRMREDSLGRSTVLYFPGVPFAE